MPKLALSDTGIRSFPVPHKGQVDYWDKALPGFGVRVGQGGSRTFVLKLENVRRTIGRFLIVSLSEARTEARKQLAERTLGKFRPRAIAYPVAVDEFLEEKKARRRERTVEDHRRHLSLLGFKGQIAGICHDDLVRKLKGLPPSEFNHRLACAKTFFNWAQKKRHITENPVIGLSPHPRPKRSRILNDEELKKVWEACCDEDNELPEHFRTIVKLLILTGQRRLSILL